jgi:hypothetical protein
MSVTVQVVYWRDIPAQVRLRAGRERLARPLSPRFQEAIDLAAMRAGAGAADDYLEAWRTEDRAPRQGALQALAQELADDLEAAYPPARLQALAANGGLEP